nr:ankyrin repeat-containing protein At3g12360-like [Ipomoea batatas]
MMDIRKSCENQSRIGFFSGKDQGESREDLAQANSFYLVGNKLRRILEMNPEEDAEENGAILILTHKRKGNVLYENIHSPTFSCCVGLVDPDKLKPGDLFGVNKDSYLILDTFAHLSLILGLRQWKLMKNQQRTTMILGLEKQAYRKNWLRQLFLAQTTQRRFQKLGVVHLKVFFYMGPPGTGKHSYGSCFVAATEQMLLSGSQVPNWFRCLLERSQTVRDAFPCKGKSLAYIFIDEIDAIGTKRFRIGHSSNKSGLDILRSCFVRSGRLDLDGNTVALQQLLANDELILERITVTRFDETPLHIAAMRGHVEFAAAILERNIELASELDSRKMSPLHIASVKGNVRMVKLLVWACPEMCVARDRYGRNPLHLAAMKGRVGVVKELLRTRPEAARQRTDFDETVLHLCVKHNQLEALEMMLESIESKGDGDEFVNATVKDFVRNKQADVNGNGKTEIEDTTLAQEQRELSEGEWLQSPEIPEEPPSTGGAAMGARRDTPPNNRQPTHQAERPSRRKNGGAIMVAASVLATMAFQAGVTPPGGVWINNDSAKYNKLPVGRRSPPPHKAGEAVMSSDNRRGGYHNFLDANTLAFIASLTAVLIELSGLNLRWIDGFLRLIMWFTVASLVVTYGVSAVLVTSHNSVSDLSQTVKICITIWCVVMGLVVQWNNLRRLYMSKPWLGIARLGKNIVMRGKNIVMSNNYWSRVP